ncbi:MAG: hypothetical protein EOO38_07020 [Cytophagaceae bacterium]|nr:MAG: hypothetical protein EOO38_07020 [Cytophagaceae bacterium]
MPSTIYVNGKTIAVPGAYSTVDASGLDAIGLTATGIVALIGSASGGKPYTAIKGTSDFTVLTQPAQAARVYRSGDLLEAAAMAFNPSSDPDIQGGAQQVVSVKVNPATQATLVLGDGNVTLTSRDYGYFANDTRVTLASGSVSGQMVIVTNGVITEVGDNLDNSDASGVVDWLNANSSLVSATTQAVATTAVGKDILCGETTVSAGDEFGMVLNGNGYGYTAVAGDGPAQIIQLFYSRVLADAPGIGKPSVVTVDGQPALRVLPAHSGAAVEVRGPTNLTVKDSPPVAISDGTPPALDNMDATSLNGGSEGAATFKDWQNCLNLLKQIRVNTIVPLTQDAAVHSAVDAHCAYMCGLGRSERDAVVGLGPSGGSALPTKQDLINKAQNLSTRNLRCVGQSVTRYNTQGVLTEFGPHFLAVLAAGMQAGGVPGISLTHKTVNCLGLGNDTSWNTVDDANELILSGILFAELKNGLGFRWVRNVTCYLGSNNSAFSDAGVNNAVNFAVYTVRNALEYAIGRELFSGTGSSLSAIAGRELALLLKQGIIAGYRRPVVVPDPDAPDTLLIDLPIAPTQPLNFINLTVHLDTASQIATLAAA